MGFSSPWPHFQGSGSEFLFFRGLYQVAEAGCSAREGQPGTEADSKPGMKQDLHKRRSPIVPGQKNLLSKEWAAFSQILCSFSWSSFCSSLTQGYSAARLHRSWTSKAQWEEEEVAKLSVLRIQQHGCYWTWDSGERADRRHQTKGGCCQCHKETLLAVFRLV